MVPGPQHLVVRPRQDPDARLFALAEAQSGVVTLSQAADLGVGPWAARRLATTQWQRMAPGVFHLGLGPPSWHAQAWAGLLIGGPRARIAGTSAAYLHGLEREAPTTVEVLVPIDRQVRDRWPWTFRRERSGVRDPRSVGALSRTTVEDTVLDLVDQATTAGEVQGLVAHAVQQRRTTVVRLRRAAAGRARLRHRRLVEAQLHSQRLHGFWRGVGAQQHLRGIAGQHLEHHEHHGRRGNQGGDQGKEAFEEKDTHGEGRGQALARWCRA